MSRTNWGIELIEPVTPGRDHIRGPVDAPVTLLEYGDYECPFCGAAQPVVEAVRATTDEGLTFAFRHYPLTTVHPHAYLAASAAEAAGAQQMFWEMHDLLFEDQGHLEGPTSSPGPRCSISTSTRSRRHWQPTPSPSRSKRTSSVASEAECRERRRSSSTGSDTAERRTTTGCSAP